MHPTVETLNNVYKNACQCVEIGAIYYHYRNPDLTYQVINLGFDEETNEISVIYKSLYANNLIWVRKLSSWLDMVEYQGKHMARFSKK